MLNILRRGPASATTSLFSTPFCSQCIRAIRLRGGQQRGLAPRIAYPLAARSFGTSPQWRRYAAAAAAHEEDANEGEIEQEVYAEESPSDAQIKQATKQGPATKFKDLADRGLVCRTVVDTLTKDMGLETMTQVQSLTLNESLKGADM